MFERLRDALRAALDAATPPGDLRDLAHQMREAVVEAKLAAGETGEVVARTERELVQERQRLADAERRGRLAAEIQDRETVEVAQRFAAKHRERAAVLEKKLAALRDELSLYERELGDMQAQLVRAERDRPLTAAERSAERAWRDLQAAGGARPGTDAGDELKKKMKKD
jgi:predicted  nucleic acid-binding Zn-ribbon protein